jgi:preprotein translocase subunit YajC
MEPLFILAVTFALLWVIFILPQQRRVRAHQALVASVQPGDEVILSAGIHGRIVELGPDELMLEIAPGVEIRVARQAVLRLVAAATGVTDDAAADADDLDTHGAASLDLDADRAESLGGAGTTATGDVTADDGTDDLPDADTDSPPPADGGASGPAVPDPDNRGPAAPGPNV